MIGDNVVFEESFEVLLAIFGEEEGVDLRAEFLECEVGGCEECSSYMWSGLQDFKETSLLESELKGGEFAGEELNDRCRWWRWEEEGIDTVNYTITSEL